jgi:RNA polymerase sigma-70 factor (ECF subfamily)
VAQTDRQHARIDPVAALASLEHGDDAAFLTLYQDVHPRLLRYAQVLVGADADDVVSESWLHIVRDADRFSGDHNDFRRWAATITRNRAMDHLRHERRRPVTPAPIEELAAAAVAAENDAADAAMDELATAAAISLIGSLPADQAEAVMLRVVMGLDAKAAGQVVGKRAGAVRMAAHRGLKRLAGLLEREEETDRPGER